MIDEKYRLGENIRRIRNLHGESQGDLAAALGVSKSAVSAWETGEKKPDRENLFDIAKRYGTTVEVLLYVDHPDIKISYSDFADLSNTVIDEFLDPIISDKAMENDSFKEAYNMDVAFDWYNFLDDLNRCSIWDRCLNLYHEAFTEGINEAGINILRIVLLMELEYLSNNKGVKIPTEKPSQKEWKEFLKSLLIYTNNEEGVRTDCYEDRIDNLFDYEVYSYRIIQKIRDFPEYRDLLEFYIAIKYAFGIACNGRPREINSAIGFEMMSCLNRVGNKHATKIMDVINSIIDKNVQQG